jgi:hypothetical protein
MITTLSSDSLSVELDIAEMDIAACRKTIWTAQQHAKVYRQSLTEALARKRRIVEALKKL